MPSLAVLVAGRLNAVTGGSIYNRRMIDALVRRGWSVHVRELADSFPYPSEGDLAGAADVLSALDDDSTVVIDGLAFGAMPHVLRSHEHRLRFIPLIHLPLALEPGLTPDTAGRLDASERCALQTATVVVATGATTIESLIALGVPDHRIAVVEPGVDRMPISRGSGGSSLNLLCVAAMTPGKGHATLLRALSDNLDEAWTLTCVGSLTRDLSTVEAIGSLLDGHDRLRERVTLTGELTGDALEDCFMRADLFVSATLRETYGMAVAQALAHGLPVIGTWTGAIPQLVGTEAGAVVPPGDDRAFAAALSCALRDAAWRARVRDGALAVRQQLVGWDTAACRLAVVIEGVEQRG
ncbi:MAG TPA: glycosyltransferase family 4 protein [Vicinamibacterales bacterium]|jgi:glycosyltransferase involved in cell wall biosynthesis